MTQNYITEHQFQLILGQNHTTSFLSATHTINIPVGLINNQPQYFVKVNILRIFNVIN